MADGRLRHLFPGNTASSARYTNPSRGDGEESLPRRQRGTHATMIRTLVVDDEPLVRERLRTLLAARADVQVCH